MIRFNFEDSLLNKWYQTKGSFKTIEKAAIFIFPVTPAYLDERDIVASRFKSIKYGIIIAAISKNRNTGIRLIIKE